MKISILVLGTIGVILFILSVYAFFTSGKHFRSLAGGFLITAVTVFVLVIIRTLKEQFDIGKK